MSHSRGYVAMDEISKDLNVAMNKHAYLKNIINLKITKLIRDKRSGLTYR